MVKIVKSIAKHSIVFVLIVALVSCSTMVTINSEPEGAEVYLDQRYMGDTPITKELSNLITHQYRIRLEKEGYKTIRGELQKEIKPGILVVGILLTWIPLLWVYGPQEHHFYKLQPKTGETAASAVIINERPEVITYVDGEKLDNGVNRIEPGEHTFGFKHEGLYAPGKTVSLKAGYVYKLN
jgi:hypothetical protein